MDDYAVRILLPPSNKAKPYSLRWYGISMSIGITLSYLVSYMTILFFESEMAKKLLEADLWSKLFLLISTVLASGLSSSNRSSTWYIFMKPSPPPVISKLPIFCMNLRLFVCDNSIFRRSFFLQSQIDNRQSSPPVAITDYEIN